MLRTEWVTESFPDGKGDKEAKLSNHVSLAQRLGMSEAIQLFPQYIFKKWTWKA